MINQSHKLSGPFLIDLKNRFRQIAGSDNKIDRKEFKNGLLIEMIKLKIESLTFLILIKIIFWMLESLLMELKN